MSVWMDAAFTRAYPGTSIHGAFQWVDRPRRVTALFGPSGCGKTTLLRCLAGLERLDDGYIRAFGQTWSDAAQRIHVAPQHRGVGFLFQEYMLFPHLNVYDNVAFGTSPLPGRQAQVEQLLNRFQLTGLERRFPRQLSGGQQQRVALARVLAAQPRLLCLDEPLSALDSPTRTELRIALREWLHELQLPALIVSHDAIEVQALADDLVVMSAGRIHQTGTVAEVLHHPVDLTVARIVGFENFLPVTVAGRDSDGVLVDHAGWSFRGIHRQPVSTATQATACIRAEDIRLVPPTACSAVSGREQSATILELIPEGVMLRVRLRLTSGPPLQALISRSAATFPEFQSGATISIDLADNAAVIIPLG